MREPRRSGILLVGAVALLLAPGSAPGGTVARPPYPAATTASHVRDDGSTLQVSSADADADASTGRAHLQAFARSTSPMAGGLAPPVAADAQAFFRLPAFDSEAGAFTVVVRLRISGSAHQRSLVGLAHVGLTVGLQFPCPYEDLECTSFADDDPPWDGVTFLLEDGRSTQTDTLVELTLQGGAVTTACDPNPATFEPTIALTGFVDASIFSEASIDADLTLESAALDDNTCS